MAFSVFAMLEFMSSKFGGSKEQEQEHKLAKQKGDLGSDSRKFKKILERAEQDQEINELVSLNMESVSLDKKMESLKQKINIQLETHEAIIRDAEKLSQRTLKEIQEAGMKIDALLANCDQTSDGDIRTKPTQFDESKQQEQDHKLANQRRDLGSDSRKVKKILERAEQDQEIVEELVSLDNKSVSLDKKIEVLKQEINIQLEGRGAVIRDAEKISQRTGKENQKTRMNIDALLANCDRTSAASVETLNTIKSMQLERDEARASSAVANHILRQMETYFEDTHKTQEKREQRLHDELERLKSTEYLESLKMTWQLEYNESAAKEEIGIWQQKLDTFNASEDRFEQLLECLKGQIDSMPKYKKGYSSSMQLKAPCGCTFSLEEMAEYHAAKLEGLYDEARSVLRSQQALAKSISEKLDETLKTAQKARTIIAEFDTSSG